MGFRRIDRDWVRGSPFTNATTVPLAAATWLELSG